MATGEDLIDVIIKNAKLLTVNNCPGVSVNVGKAVYGKYQDDAGPGKSIVRQEEAPLKQAIQKAIAVHEQATSQHSGVWHFLLDPVHHFIVIPWLKVDHPAGQVYTVLMAYEGKYTLEEYVKGQKKAPRSGSGYKPFWSQAELSDMLYELLTSGSAWERYFGDVGAAHATKITYWKYQYVDISKAIERVKLHK